MINQFAASGRSAAWRNAVVAAGAGTGLVLLGGLVWPQADTRSGFLAGFDPSVHAQTPPSAESRGALPDFPDIVDRVKPAVVGVRVQIEDETVGGEVPPGRSRSSPSLRAPREGPGEPHRPLAVSQGSGFFISADGYVVTTQHVINNGKVIEVTTDDRKTHPARLIGSDDKSDLALLKAEGVGDVPFVRLAGRPPRIGEWVLAIGNPFGLGGTVTAGIVSARSRDIKMGTYNDYIQIDAPMNRGNSGGPTFDMNGEVIGVNSAIFSPTGGSIGIGFAIPADIVRSVVGQLKEKGAVRRGWIGIKVRPATEETAQGLGAGAKVTQGALIVEPLLNSPAARAGLAAGDIITTLNDEPIKDDRELIRKIADLAPGTPVKLGVLRKGEMLTITLSLDEPPASRGEAPAGRRGQQRGQATPAVRRMLEIEPFPNRRLELRV